MVVGEIAKFFLGIFILLPVSAATAPLCLCIAGLGLKGKRPFPLVCASASLTFALALSIYTLSHVNNVVIQYFHATLIGVCAGVITSGVLQLAAFVYGVSAGSCALNDGSINVKDLKEKEKP